MPSKGSWSWRRQLLNCLPVKENRPLLMLRSLGRLPLQWQRQGSADTLYVYACTQSIVQAAKENSADRTVAHFDPGWNFNYKTSGLGSSVKKSMVFTAPSGPCAFAFCGNPRSYMFSDSKMGWVIVLRSG